MEFNLIRDLVSLEAAMYSGEFPQTLDETEVKLIYTFFIAARMGREGSVFSYSELPFLLEPNLFENEPLPRFISMIDTFMGRNYFRKVWKSAFSHEDFEVYLSSVVLDGLGKVLKGKQIRIPLYLSRWLQKETLLSKETGIFVPLSVKMILFHDPAFRDKTHIEAVNWFIQWANSTLAFEFEPWFLDAYSSAFSNDQSRIHSSSGKPSVKENISGIKKAPSRLISDGVNLVGWPFAEIGIGEDIRVAAEALLKVNMEFKILDAAERLPPKTPRVDLGHSKYQSAIPEFPVDVVFLDASTQYRYYCFDAIEEKAIERTIVAVSPWELPLWPSNGKFALSNVDHFFAATKFIYDAFKPYFPESRIHHVSPAVYIPEEFRCSVVSEKISGPLKFLTIFDGYSSIHRKNPIATIKAFQLAFPKTNSNVQLIVKMMNTPLDNEVFEELVSLVRSDQRIEVINKTLKREELFDLIKSSHCFVSLHRSEGFGRNIAESMILGRPVIVSEFSGNLDFCFEDNSFLVKGELVPVEPHMYSFSRDQVWFDASIEDAAHNMKSVYENWSLAVEKAKKGQEYMLKNYSLEAMGQRYEQALKKVKA